MSLAQLSPSLSCLFISLDKINQEFLWYFQIFHASPHSCIRVSYSKTTDESIDDSDDEDDNEGDVVDDICILLMIIFIDIETTKNKEKNSHNYLKYIMKV